MTRRDPDAPNPRLVVTLEAETTRVRPEDDDSARQESERERARWIASRRFACPQCGRVLFDYCPPLAWLRIRCRKCGAWLEVEDVREVAA